MFSVNIIDDSRSINVIRMTMVSEATTRSITYDHNSDDGCIFILQATVFS